MKVRPHYFGALVALALAAGATSGAVAGAAAEDCEPSCR